MKRQGWPFSGGWVRSLICVLNWIETSSFQCTIEVLRCFHVSNSWKQVDDVYLHLDCVCVCVYECVCVCPRTCACMYSVMSDSLKPYGLCSPPGSSVHGILQARILELGSHSFLQGICPTQGLKPGLLHCRQILCHLSHWGSSGFIGAAINYHWFREGLQLSLTFQTAVISIHFSTSFRPSRLLYLVLCPISYSHPSQNMTSN